MTRIGSLCSGYGGLDLAVAAHYGATVAWHAEIDKDCDRVLKARFPSVPNLGDLTVLDWAEVEPVDILCGGFPCQPFSTAGLRRGVDDERAIFQHIADCVAELQPRRVVLENVPGLISTGPGRGGGLDVIATLAGLDYVGRAGVIRASDTAAPHRRARWFCVAEPADASGFDEERPVGARVSGGESESATGDSGGAAADAGGMGRGEGTGPGEGEPAELRRHGPSDSDGAAAPDADEPGGEAWSDTGHPRERIRQQPVGSAAPATDFGPYGGAVERWERILGRRAPDPTDDRGLRPEFVEWMMGLDQGYICDLGLSRSAALRILGNGVLPAQAALALTLLDPIPNHDQEAR